MEPPGQIVLKRTRCSISLLHTFVFYYCQIIFYNYSLHSMIFVVVIYLLSVRNSLIREKLMILNRNLRERPIPWVIWGSISIFFDATRQRTSLNTPGLHSISCLNVAAMRTRAPVSSHPRFRWCSTHSKCGLFFLMVATYPHPQH